MKNNNNWKDNWFGSWLDIDIVIDGNKASRVKKSRKIPRIDNDNFELTNICKQYIAKNKDVTTT